MDLTQRAGYADLQSYLGLTSTTLPDADATTILSYGFHDLFIMFSKNAITYDETSTKKVAIQKEAEIYLGAYYFYKEFAPKKMVVDFETYDEPLSETIDLGGFKIGGKVGSKTELAGWYRVQGLTCKNMAEDKIAKLMLGETVPVVEGNFL